MSTKMIKSICSFVLIVILTVTVFVQTASASTTDGFYTFNKTQFNQGIEAVECVISVNPETHNALWLAIRDAIRDWDWHLGLLQEWYGVNWNMYAVSEDLFGTGSFPEIEFRAMTRSSFDNSYNDYYANIPLNSLAVTRLYKPSTTVNRTHVDLEVNNWESTEVIFFTDKLSSAGYINNYEALKTIANHEIGHTLGLAHDNYNTGVIMYPTYGSDMTATVPTRRDLETVYYIYGN